MTELDWAAVIVTAQLAGVTTLVLLVIGTPLAWWLSITRNPLKPSIEAVVALPLVLPPTVLGFYLLVLMNPNGLLGAAWLSVVGDTLTFSFSGLVIASSVYSLPFMVQPLHATFESINRDWLEAAATMRASPFDIFRSVVLPVSRRGFLAALVLTFAHTVGEFGVVLMIGGNVPGETRVLSVAIYEHVEVLNYDAANQLSIGLLLFSFVVLSMVYWLNRERRLGVH